MVLGNTRRPFYRSVQSLISWGLKNPEEVIKDMLDNAPYFYDKRYIMAFIGYSKQEVDDMGVLEYIRCMAIVGELKKYWHLPFRKDA